MFSEEEKRKMAENFSILDGIPLKDMEEMLKNEIFEDAELQELLATNVELINKTIQYAQNRIKDEKLTEREQIVKIFSAIQTIIESYLRLTTPANAQGIIIGTILKNLNDSEFNESLKTLNRLNNEKR